MKRIAFILSIVLISIFSTCNAVNDGPGASATAKQFGYYVAFGDAVKASITVNPETDITVYVNRVKAEIDQLGGLDKIVIDNEEVIGENEVKVTISFICKKEDAKVQKTYTLLRVNDTWKIEMDKL